MWDYMFILNAQQMSLKELGHWLILDKMAQSPNKV